MARFGGYSSEKRQKTPIVMTTMMDGCNFSKCQFFLNLVAVCERYELITAENFPFLLFMLRLQMLSFIFPNYF